MEGGQVQESQKRLLSFFSKMRGSRRILSRGLDFLKKDHSGCWVEDKGQEQVQQQLGPGEVKVRCIRVQEVGSSSRILRICPGYCYYNSEVNQMWGMKEREESRMTSRLLA